VTNYLAGNIIPLPYERGISTVQHWNPETVRIAIQRFITDEKIGSVSKWEEDAGLSQGVLRKFLNRKTKDIGLGAITRLAAARRVTVANLIGEPASSGQAYIDTNLLAHVIAELDRMLSEAGISTEAVDREQRARAIAALYDAEARHEATAMVYTSVVKMALPSATKAPRLSVVRNERSDDARG
jgi:hypothetical protein